MQRAEGSIAVPDREKIGMQDFRMETFLAVCRHLNYTRAAEELCITQPVTTHPLSGGTLRVQAVRKRRETDDADVGGTDLIQRSADDETRRRPVARSDVRGL